MNEHSYQFDPLPKPIPITEHEWSEGTEPLVHTRTMTFNHENYIQECIEGILMQRTTFPVQVLIHDDASTDETAKIVKEYELKYPKLIKAFYQKENSYMKPDKHERRREFWSWRVGKYEAMCEGDDYWIDPLKLQKQVDIMEHNPEYVMCSGGYRTYDEKTNKYTDNIMSKYGNEICLPGFIYTLDDMKNNWMTKTLTVLYRLEKYNIIKSNLINYKYSRDVQLFYELMKERKAYYISEPLGIYRKHGGGSYSSLNIEKNTILTYNTYKEMYEINNDNYSRYKYLQAINRYIKNIILGNINKTNKNKILQRKIVEAIYIIRNTKELRFLIKNILISHYKKVIYRSK